jgi:hypothetical protein
MPSVAKGVRPPRAILRAPISPGYAMSSTWQSVEAEKCRFSDSARVERLQWFARAPRAARVACYRPAQAPATEPAAAVSTHVGDARSRRTVTHSISRRRSTRPALTSHGVSHHQSSALKQTRKAAACCGGEKNNWRRLYAHLRRRGGWAWLRRRRRRTMEEPSPAGEPGAECIEIDVDDRRSVKREQLACEQAANDGDAQGLPQFGPLANAQRQR